MIRACALVALVCLGCSRATSDVGPAPSVTRPEASAAPGAYDLDGDVRARIELGRGLLGDAAATAALLAVVGEVFVILAEHPGPFFDASIKLARDALGAYFHGRFSTRPREAITVFIFPTARAYQTRSAESALPAAPHAGAKCDTALGFYRPESRELFVNLEPGLPTLTHELVHPIVATAPTSPARRRGLNEGLSARFLRDAPSFRARARSAGSRTGGCRRYARRSLRRARARRRGSTRSSRCPTRPSRGRSDEGSALRGRAPRMPVARGARPALAVLPRVARRI